MADDSADYPWDDDGEALPVEEAVAGEAAGEYYEGEYPDEAGENYEGGEGNEEEDGMAWDGDEAEAAEANVEIDLAFEALNATHDAGNDGRHERALLAKLRKELLQLFPRRKFELEPFGSYVTNLGLPNSDGSGRSDLDVVLLFHDTQADSTDRKDIRDAVVLPIIDRLGAWLQTRPGTEVKNIIRKARVPIVMFSTRELEVDVSVQQPWGVLNSWHLRDLCDSGRPGRLRLLVRLVKMWAKSKSVHSAKDGALSSYGYAMLAAGYLRECGALAALLPNDGSTGKNERDGPYLDSHGALEQVLEGCRAARARAGGAGAHAGAVADEKRRSELWREPQPLAAGASAEADASPMDLFIGWMEWMSNTVLAFAGKEKEANPGCSTLPLSKRHIVSVRERSQQKLRLDVTWCPKAGDHWSPSKSEVYLLIEEPLSGENVARCVRADGFRAIHAEVKRACEFLAEQRENDEPEEEVEEEDEAGEKVSDGLGLFRKLLELPPLMERSQPPNGVGVRHAGWKRPFGGGGDAEGPPHKKPAWRPPWAGAQQAWTPGVAVPQGAGYRGGYGHRGFGPPLGFRARPQAPGARAW